MKFRLLMALGLVSALCACSPIRPSKFQCPHPEGVSCMSTLEVYEHTEFADRVEGRGEGNVATHARTTPAMRTEPTSAWVEPQTAHQVTEEDGALALIDPPATARTASIESGSTTAEPLRAPAKVLRIWLAPWEDSRGDLHMSGYVYSEVEGRKWRVGQPAAPSRPTLRLLEAPRAASTQAAK